jgi:aryl-alcohol dehydrogenase (NADP+)
MEYVRLGSTGLKVSRICLGTMTYGTPEWRPWILDEAASRPFFVRALEHGINFFDTADMYSRGVSEQVLGRALKDHPRDELVIATKAFYPVTDGPNNAGQSRKHLFSAIDASLSRLGTDYVDLYQIHRFDYETPIEETLEALNDVVRAGKVRYLGASAMWAWQFMKMLMTADQRGFTRFSSFQCYYNILYREQEREVLPMCRAEGIAVIPYSPLARGFVAGNRKRDGGGETVRSNSDPYSDNDYYHEQDFAIVDRITQVARKRGVKNAQVAMAWILQQPGITAPILGASKPEHLEEAVAALSLKLDAEEVKTLEELYQPRAIIGKM